MLNLPKNKEEAEEIKDQLIPKVGRTICGDALEILFNMIKTEGIEFEEIIEEGVSKIEKLVGPVSSLNPVARLIKNKCGFDPTNVMTYPDDSSQWEDFGKILGLGSTIAPHNFKEGNKEPYFIFSSFLYYLVIVLKIEEREFIKNPEIDYSAFMNKVDPIVTLLHQSCVFAKTLNFGLNAIEMRNKRRESGRKGGLVKSNKKMELQEHVLEKAKTNYIDNSASHAAREIFAGLDDTWLMDNKSEYLYKDFIRNFEDWIRTDRKRTPTKHK